MTSRYLVKVKVGRDSYIVYHSLFGRPLQMSRAAIALISSFGPGRAISSVIPREKLGAYRPLLTHAEKSGFLVPKGTDERAIFYKQCAAMRKAAKARARRNPKISIGALRLELASCCNFRCSFCFAEKVYAWKPGSLMPFETARLAVDGFVRTLKKRRVRTADVIFWGGEPLLNWDVARRTVLYIEREMKGSPIKLDMGFCTNGSLVTDEIAEFMKEHSLTATVSLDGTRAANDSFRRYANGRETYDSIIRGMSIFHKHGVRMVAQGVLHDKNFYDYEDMMDTLNKKFGIWQFIVTPVYFQKRPNDFDNHTALSKAKRLAAITAYAEKKKYALAVENCNLMEDLLGGKVHCFSCTGKGATFYVKPDGSLHPCQGICMPLGDVWHIDQMTKGDAFAHAAYRGVDKLTGCRGCEVEGLCAGGCSGLAQFHSGDIYDTSDPVFQASHCDVRRHLLKERLKLHAKKKGSGQNALL